MARVGFEPKPCRLEITVAVLLITQPTQPRCRRMQNGSEDLFLLTVYFNNFYEVLVLL